MRKVLESHELNVFIEVQVSLQRDCYKGNQTAIRRLLLQRFEISHARAPIRRLTTGGFSFRLMLDEVVNMLVPEWG